MDLHFFWRADALVWNGRVSEGNTTGLADTRILAWTAPGDDGRDGNASLYDVRYVTSADIAALGAADAQSALIGYWDNLRKLTGEPDPNDAGNLEQIFLPAISPDDTVWFAMRAVDEVGQESVVSNIAGPFRVRRLAAPLRPRTGDTVTDYGTPMAGPGDVNGDNYRDMLLGSPGEGSITVIKGGGNLNLLRGLWNAQGVYVYRAIAELTPVTTIAGNIADLFGASAAGLFNQNGDVLMDIGAGAPDFSVGATVEQGAAYVFYGRVIMPAALSASSVDVIITGDAAGDHFGSSLSPAFDLDGDGRDEFMVSSPDAYGTGAAYVFRGLGLVSGAASNALAIIKGEAAGDEFGTVLSTIGDVNGDGYPDVAVGAPLHDEPGAVAAGAVYVFYGGENGVAGFAGLAFGQTVVVDLSATRADVTIRGTEAGRMFGKAISAGGNLAGDLDAAYDFAVSGGDTVYVFFGGAAAAVPFPLAGSSVEGADVNASARLSGVPGEEFGAALLGVGDINLDHTDDLLVGAPGADKCYLFPGPIVNGMAAEESIEGDVAGHRFGAALAGTGDVNYDGFNDLMIGAPLAGQAYFIF